MGVPFLFPRASGDGRVNSGTGIGPAVGVCIDEPTKSRDSDFEAVQAKIVRACRSIHIVASIVHSAGDDGSVATVFILVDTAVRGESGATLGHTRVVQAEIRRAVRIVMTVVGRREQARHVVAAGARSAIDIHVAMGAIAATTNAVEAHA